VYDSLGAPQLGLAGEVAQALVAALTMEPDRPCEFATDLAVEMASSVDFEFARKFTSACASAVAAASAAAFAAARRSRSNRDRSDQWASEAFRVA
jgi:hypothetical protein